VRRDWEPEDLVASWTLVEQDERELVAYKRGATRLGFALMLKFFEIEARFPRHASEFPPAAVAYVARQVDVAPTELGGYEWVGRTAEYHRSQIRLIVSDATNRFVVDAPRQRDSHRWQVRAGP
jgi:hypothetical protein